MRVSRRGFLASLMLAPLAGTLRSSGPWRSAEPIITSNMLTEELMLKAMADMSRRSAKHTVIVNPLQLDHYLKDTRPYLWRKRWYA